ncbi:aspartate carbamoyltransferase catalytic subunit [Gracilibacillus caseinilyticus]|uniref:Aspartate carbamoyltransferase n=1 Tax=Gracilibacillus caseinilyticus TaxID=2932256 RepID=A0ABY4EUP2_9BACI|nr:aspartate carbamoyltransferase catalytic subunit [Gracilibacillus caseinilyticus]UOQ47938.1 aspartate carbamoyltransferase catalytic subunit [Gracilibacillus caseinilyticus]
MKHFVTMKDQSEADILQLVKKADYISKHGTVPFQSPFFAANLFFEPSTRTKMSFVVAERKLGIEPLDFAADSSSVTKGESIYDTARTFESIGANVIVLRHQQENIASQLADSISIPVINAGDGTGEHPTQSLLDLVTIYQEFQQFKGVKVVIAGDIKHSRVARSNAYALSTLGAEVYLTGMEQWQDNTLPYPYVPIDEATEIADVFMLLRIQHERHQDHVSFQQESYLEQYGLTLAREAKMKHDAIIMHPAPVNRGVEIDTHLVECGRSRIFKQMQNGVATRMAVIETLLNQGGTFHEKTINKRQAITG